MTVNPYDLQLLLKLVHLFGAALLFGTGAGIAFFMWMAHRTGEPAFIAGTARIVVIADTVFTATAVVVQPLSGVALARLIGYSLWDAWIVLSIGLYLLAGACWLPVVWIQIRLRDLAREAASGRSKLSAQYHRLFRVWFALGWPAFAAVMATFALMVWKPVFW